MGFPKVAAGNLGKKGQSKKTGKKGREWKKKSELEEAGGGTIAAAAAGAGGKAAAEKGGKGKERDKIRYRPKVKIS